MNRIHIKIADTGWILEKCAREIAVRSNKVTYGTHADPSAQVQYYVNYSARSQKVSPIELAFFTHSEKDEGARRRYFSAAEAMDHCVCMSQRYADELAEAGHSNVSVIAPGVDLEEFRPKVRIGVVGRTYHTGRKGEALVAEVMDIPGIEWRFTGAGWPGPSTFVPDAGMADFYNDLDYVLIPALYEGGPMAVLEGLACGVPVISSDVGWAQEFPHIPFENNDAASLRRVLVDLVDQRLELRAAVLERSWSQWADQHLALFDRLLAAAGTTLTTPARAPFKFGATLITHGQEKVTLGGPSVRVPKTVSALRSLGIDAVTPNMSSSDDDRNPIAHVFNLWPGASCHAALKRARAAGKKVVLSPIFLNLSNQHLSSQAIPQLFAGGRSDLEIDRVLKEIAAQVADESNLPLREPVEGYHAMVRACTAAADGVIFLSEYERHCLEHLGITPRKSKLIRNPVDFGRFAGADPNLFVERFGLEGYILCLGRIEHRKNQLVLAHAAKTLGKHVVFIGHPGNSTYEKLVREAAGDFGTFIPRIDPDDPLLPSAFAAASAFCLPSWSEGAPLAALEAAASGLPMVLSDRASEQEYFGSHAEYVNPADVDGLRAALMRAEATRNDHDRQVSIAGIVEKRHSWDLYANETAQFYEKLLGQSSKSAVKKKSIKKAPIYLDLTTSIHSSGNPTGISRVELRALSALLDQYGTRVIPITWNSNTRNFLILERANALLGIKLADLDAAESLGSARLADESSIHSEGSLVVLGGAWIRNPAYTEAIRSLKAKTGISLKVLVHDLIQMKLSYLYPKGTGEEFERNARKLLDVSDGFLVYSDATKKDLKEFLLDTDTFFKPIDKFRLGDMTNLYPEKDASETVSPLQMEFFGKRFVIYVSSIESRKNHELLINVWRRLAEERGSRTPQLIFIGRPIWNGERVIEQVQRDPKIKSVITILSDVNDRDLDWFYRNCAFTVYPSLYEGWGLPVAESLSYGKLCLTSSTTATAEIAPSLTELLDPYDFRAWHDRIALFLDNDSIRQSRERMIAKEYSEVTWSRAVTEIVSIIDSSKKEARTYPTLYLQKDLKFFNNNECDFASLICLNGWSAAEQTGRWSVGGSSALSFEFFSEAEIVYLRLSLRAFTKPGASRNIAITVNGSDRQEFDLFGAVTTLDLQIKRTNPNGARQIARITFEPGELLSPNMVTGSNDKRLLGVQLIWAQLAEHRELLGNPQSPPRPAPALAHPLPATQHASSDQALKRAKDLIALPPRFTGKKPISRIVRMIGLDKLWLRMHARQFRRVYSSINLLIDHLSTDERR